MEIGQDQNGGLRVVENPRGGALYREGVSERDLVALSLKGDKRAYRVLVERYQARILAAAYRVVRNREDAEDIAQESFVKAYLSLRTFKGQSSFYTWLYRITYNMSIDFKRKVARRGGESLELNEETASLGRNLSGQVRPVSPDEALDRKETCRGINAAMQSLSDEHRSIIALREVEGLSYDEIAQAVGISKGTVMSRLHYARKKLQNALRASGFGSVGRELESPSGGEAEEILKAERE